MPFFFFKRESFLLNWISCVAYWVALGSSVPLIQGIWGEKPSEFPWRSLYHLPFRTFSIPLIPCIPG